jgi:hypothetical protein
MPTPVVAKVLSRPSVREASRSLSKMPSDFVSSYNNGGPLGPGEG